MRTNDADEESEADEENRVDEENDTIPGGWTSGTVEANEIDLHYVRTGGDGPPFVISHGVTDDGLCRLPLARELEGEYDVVLYDARGHGRSDAPEGDYGAATRAADLVGLIDALGLDDPYLFGHSMGGDTVAAAAANHPDLPRAVVLEDPAAMLGGDDADDRDDDRQERAAQMREQIRQWNASTKAEVLAEDDWIRELSETGREALASRLADARRRLRPTVAKVFEAGFADPETTYPDIEAPTLILRADVDEADRARDREQAARVPNGWLVHVENAGHCIFWDQRETATQELRAFLDEV